MPSAEQIETELNEWLDANFTPDLGLREWRERLVDAGWASVQWPAAHLGRGFDGEQTAVVHNVLARRRVVPGAGGRRLAAEAVVVHGTEDQKRRYLRPTLTGDHQWSLLYSEPGSGSDMAAATTTAERDGDSWIITGEKCWTTSASSQRVGTLLARTDWDQPKHQGLSFFLIDLDQPGVVIEPIKQMNGYESFYRVKLHEAVVADVDLLGGPGNGWAVASTALSFERSRFTDFSLDTTGLEGRLYDEYRREQAEEARPTIWYPQRAGRAGLVVDRAREQLGPDDAVRRQQVADVWARRRLANLSGERAAAAEEIGRPNPAGSIAKIQASDIAKRSAVAHGAISESDAMLTAPSSEEPLIAEILLSTPSMSIAGGTDEIQRNILGERILGLPKEPRADTGPYREVRHND